MLIPPEVQDPSRTTEGLYFPSEAAGSFRQMAGRLERIAAHGPHGVRIAHFVTRRYGDALANHPDPQVREQQWREFFVALHSFLMLHSRDQSRDVLILQSILDENADLLPAHREEYRVDDDR